MGTKTEQIADRLAGVFTDPIIAFPGGWGEDIPDWLRREIIIERLILAKDDIRTGTDAEACAYLMTTSQAQPLDEENYHLYMYVFNKLMGKRGTKVPEDLVFKEISQYEQGLLNHLKQQIYDKRVKVGKEKRRNCERKVDGITVSPETSTPSAQQLTLLPQNVKSGKCSGEVGDTKGCPRELKSGKHKRHK